MEILIANEDCLEELCRIDRQLDDKEQLKKIRKSEVILARKSGEIVGVIRHSLFWDKIPFINWLWVKQEHRRRGVGKTLVSEVAKIGRELGQKVVLASTQSDEDGQHFYRKIGFVDIGGFVLENEPLEIVLSLDLTTI